MLQRVHRRYRLPPATAAGCGRCAASTSQAWPRCLIDHPVAVGRQTNQETRGRERKGACERLAPSAKTAVAPTGVVCREARNGRRRRRRPAAISIVMSCTSTRHCGCWDALWCASVASDAQMQRLLQQHRKKANSS